jgi:hypothetical protein
VTVEPSRPIGLEPVDRAEVTIVVDNFIDPLMARADGVRRYVASDFGRREWGNISRETRRKRVVALF